MHGFKDVMTGAYLISTFPNSGLLNSNASSLGINIAYVFTGNQQHQNYLNRTEAGEDPKIVKKEQRRDRRYLSPESTFVNIQFGGLITVNKVNDPGEYYRKAGSGGYNFGIEYEHGIKNNFVVTGAYYLSEYWDARRVTATPFTSGSNAFVAHDFSIGGAYRVITKSNFKLANLHAGLMSGYCSQPKGISSRYSGTSTIRYIDEEGIIRILEIDIDGESEIVSRFLMGAYLGISKDFRITDFVWLSLNYRYQLGFNNIEVSNFEYSTNEFEGINSAQSRIDGTAHRIGVGLKLRFR
jgi:hypothetical protein